MAKKLILIGLGFIVLFLAFNFDSLGWLYLAGVLVGIGVAR